MAAIIGKKLGMTQVFSEDGTRVPVTVIQAGPCPVTAVRAVDRDGYSAVQLAYGELPERKLTKAELGHLKKAGAPARPDPGRVPRPGPSTRWARRSRWSSSSPGSG